MKNREALLPTFRLSYPYINKGEAVQKDVIVSPGNRTFSDYEIVVVDDGSTDGAKRLSTVSMTKGSSYYYQTNSGLPAVARNNGTKRSRGRYIAFLDADDIWYTG